MATVVVVFCCSSVIKQTSDSSLQSLIEKAAKAIGYPSLEDKQKVKFIKGGDVFVSLPTGYGKSLCYTLLPSIFDNLRGVKKKSIVLVVSPLLALMKDQVANISAKGITAVHISDREKISRTK